MLDQNVDIAGTELLGTEIITQLLAAGYTGFACIRSGDSNDADRAASRKAGAHWHVGKELRLRDMVSQLMHEYEEFLQAQQERQQQPAAALAPSGPSGVHFNSAWELHYVPTCSASVETVSVPGQANMTDVESDGMCASLPNLLPHQPPAISAQGSE